MNTCTSAQQQFATLFRTLETIASPADLRGSLRALPEPHCLPSPWTTWLLICLLRYRERQQWARSVVQSAVPQAFPPGPELLEQDQPLEWCLGALPGWQLTLECCCDYGFGYLDDRETGEHVTFGLDDTVADLLFDDASTFDLDRGAPSPEARFRALHPYRSTAHLGIEDLLEGKLLRGVHWCSSHSDQGIAPDAYHLTAAAVEHAAVIHRFADCWERSGENALWLAALIGDWPYARDAALAARDEELIATTTPRAELVRAARMARASRRISDGFASTIDLMVLHETRAPGLAATFREAVQDEQMCPGALIFASSVRDERLCDDLFHLLERPSIPNYLKEQAAQCVAEHGHRVQEAIEILGEDPDLTGFAALLALEHTPSSALHYVRRALRSHSAVSRKLVCELLAAIDRPWSRDELKAALHGMADQAPRDAKLYERALRQSVDRWTRMVARDHAPEPALPQPIGSSRFRKEQVMRWRSITPS